MTKSHVLLASIILVCGARSATAASENQSVYLYNCGGDVSAIDVNTVKVQDKFNALQEGLVNDVKDGCSLTSLFVSDERPQIVVITPQSSAIDENGKRQFEVRWKDQKADSLVNASKIKEYLEQSPSILDSYPFHVKQHDDPSAAIQYVDTGEVEVSAIPLMVSRSNTCCDANGQMTVGLVLPSPVSLRANNLGASFDELVKDHPEYLNKVDLKQPSYSAMINQLYYTRRGGLADPFSEQNRDIFEDLSKKLPGRGWVPLRIFGQTGFFLRRQGQTSEIARISSGTKDARTVEVDGVVPTDKIEFDRDANIMIAMTQDKFLLRIDAQKMAIRSKVMLEISTLDEADIMCVSKTGFAVVRLRDSASLFDEKGIKEIKVADPVNEQTQCTFGKALGLPVFNLPQHG